jgi:hypothetical protein
LFPFLERHSPDAVLHRAQRRMETLFGSDRHIFYWIHPRYGCALSPVLEHHSWALWLRVRVLSVVKEPPKEPQLVHQVVAASPPYRRGGDARGHVMGWGVAPPPG